MMNRLKHAAVVALAVLTCVSAARADYATTVLGDGPVGYWRLGESAGPTAGDASGLGANLDYLLFPAGDFGQPGAILGDADTAVRFIPTPGANAPAGSPSTHPTIASPNSTDMGFASGQSFSVEYWIKAAPGNASVGDPGIITKGYDSLQDQPWYLSRYLTGTGRVDFYLRDTTPTNRVATSASSVNDDQWHHVVGVYDSVAAEGQIFVDGILEGVAGGVPAAAYGTNLQPFSIANHVNRPVDALVDEVAVYDSALNATQVAAHFVEGGGVPDPVLNIDFGNSSGNGGGPGGVMSGFFPFEAVEGGGDPDVTRSFLSSLGTGNFVDVTIGGYTHYRDYAGTTDGSDAISPLLSDMVLRNADATMTLQLGSLKPGSYEITTYHHSTQFGGGMLDINLSDANGTSSIASGLLVASGTNPAAAATSTFTLVSDGSPVSIDFLGGASSQHMPLNGFQLIETPTGPAQLGVVLAVDFNDRGVSEASDPSVTQAGFSEFLIGGAENNDQTAPTTRSFGGIDVTLGHSTGMGVGDRRRDVPLPGALYTFSELQRDVLFARPSAGGATTDDGLDILVENLDPDTPYEVEIWSYDDGSAPARVSNWLANGELVMEDYSFNGADTHVNGPKGFPFDDHASFSFLTTSDGSGAILIEGRYAVAGGDIGVFLNGLRVTEVVPEPSVFVLLALGALVWVPWHRRRRRS